MTSKLASKLLESVYESYNYRFVENQIKEASALPIYTAFGISKTVATSKYLYLQA